MMKFKKLSDVADLTVGYVGTMGKEYSDKGVLFLRSLNIKPFAFDLTDIKYIPEEFHTKIQKSELHTNDVVIVRTGLPGTSAVVPEALNGCNCADLVIVRPDLKKVDPYFLSAFINSWGKAQISNSKVGAVQKHFNVTSAEEMLIPDIKVKDQKSIASTIRMLNDRISNNTAICSELESMAKLLYDYWFVQFDFPDENGRPYKSSGGKMVWNKKLKREIPEGWEAKSISDISKRVKVGFVGTVDKYYCSNNEGYPIVRPAEMSADGIDYSSLRHITLDFYNKNKKSQVHKNDILISRCGKDGIPNIYDSDEPAQVLNAVIIEPDKRVACSCFINEMLKSDYSQIQILHGTSGSVQGVINTEMIAKIMMPYSFEVVNCFSEQIEKYYTMMRNAKIENQQLASLRDFLLPMLMNGQVKSERICQK